MYRLREILKKIWPTLLAVVIASVAVWHAYGEMTKYIKTTQVETVKILVPATTISPYSVIEKNDLKWRAIAKGSETPNTAKEISQAAGKMALTPLYKDEAINLQRLIDPEKVRGRQVISVQTDLGRSVGGMIEPGDLVDAWWVDSVEERRWNLAARDIIVVDILDSNGSRIKESESKTNTMSLSGESLTSSSSKSGAPSIAVLSVKDADIQNIIGAAQASSQNLVLVKKFAPTPKPEENPQKGAEQ